MEKIEIEITEAKIAELHTVFSSTSCTADVSCGDDCSCVDDPF